MNNLQDYPHVDELMQHLRLTIQTINLFVVWQTDLNSMGGGGEEYSKCAGGGVYSKILNLLGRGYVRIKIYQARGSKKSSSLPPPPIPFQLRQPLWRVLIDINYMGVYGFSLKLKLKVIIGQITNGWEFSKIKLWVRGMYIIRSPLPPTYIFKWNRSKLMMNAYFLFNRNLGQEAG